MKVSTRKSILCFKRLPNGVTDSFRVVVLANKVSEAVNGYKSRGYKVIQ